MAGFLPRLGHGHGAAGWPRIASALPLPYPHTYHPDPDLFLSGPSRPAADLWLAPAYVGAALIAQGVVSDLTRERLGTPGRAHDPEGAYTVPHILTTGALLSWGAAPTSLADLWRGEAIWPDSSRLVLGAALLRRSYSPNDTHPAHLAQVEADLLQLRPRLAADPAAWLRPGSSTVGWAPAAGYASRAGLRSAAPVEGTILIEYDWLMPAGAVNAKAALAFLRGVGRAASSLPAGAGRLTPLTPLPLEALARRAEVWARLRAQCPKMPGA